MEEEERLSEEEVVDVTVSSEVDLREVVYLLWW